MKNVLMFLVLFSGLALADISAQANCKPADCAPCPPGCCILKGCSPKTASAADEKTLDISFVSFAEEDMRKARSCQMTKKEKEACIAACKSYAAANASSSCLPAPSCHTATAGHTGSAESTSKPGIQNVSLPAKKRQIF